MYHLKMAIVISKEGPAAFTLDNTDNVSSGLCDGVPF